MRGSALMTLPENWRSGSSPPLDAVHPLLKGGAPHGDLVFFLETMFEQFAVAVVSAGDEQYAFQQIAVVADEKIFCGAAAVIRVLTLPATPSRSLRTRR